MPAVYTDVRLNLVAAERRTLRLASLAILGRFGRLAGRMGDRGFGLIVDEGMWLILSDRRWVEGRRSLLGPLPVRLGMVLRVLKSAVVRMRVRLHRLGVGVYMGCRGLRQRLPLALCPLCHPLVEGSSRGV